MAHYYYYYYYFYIYCNYLFIYSTKILLAPHLYIQTCVCNNIHCSFFSSGSSHSLVLAKTMKRAFINNNVQDAKMQSKYQNLMQDYMELQKEFVAKKKKLKSAIHKRDALLAEVSFLRRRHKQLLKAKSVTAVALDRDSVHLPNSDLKGNFGESNRNHHTANDTALTNQDV